jgi:hypothetical protein
MLVLGGHFQPETYPTPPTLEPLVGTSMIAASEITGKMVHRAKTQKSAGGSRFTVTPTSRL